MLCQRDARLFLIRPQGRPKKGFLKASGFRLVSHIRRREEIESSGGGFVNCEEMMAREWDVRGGYGEGQLHRLMPVTRCLTYAPNTAVRNVVDCLKPARSRGRIAKPCLARGC